MNPAMLQKLSKHTDLLAAGGVVLVVVMMVVPLPPMLLDLFITLNISAALAIVVSTMYLNKALEFSAFPSLLLLTTLFRLAINVSVTRLILLEGDAGHVVKAFGEFVVGANVVVGLVIFLVLIVIQFVVVTNGAGRVAEVGARFTLDAMPGKQMAIDADLNSGQITEDQARERRAEIAREADFYGAMDGASKFVKGDAMAAVLITMINLLGGIIVTRSASEKDLGNDIAGQIFRQRKAPMVAGGVICLFALVPGLPKLPFILIGGAFAAMGYMMKEGGPLANLFKEEAPQLELDAPAAELPPATDAALGALQIDPLELAIGFGLVPMVDEGAGGSLLQRVGVIRRQIAGELGMVISPVRIHDDIALDSHEYVVKVRGAEVARGRLLPGHQLAMDPGDAVGQLSGVPTTEPAFGLPAVWIAESARTEAEALGYTVVDGESVIVTHLTETIRSHAADLLTRQETRQLLDRLKEHNAAVVEEVVPDVLSVGEIQRVLQALLREGVSVRDLGPIVEAVGDKARLTRDPSVLAEYARQALSRRIVAPFVDAEGALRVIALDPAVEREIADAIAQTADGEFLAMEPTRAHALVGSLAGQLENAIARGSRPVLICSARVRRHLRRLCEQ